MSAIEGRATPAEYIMIKSLEIEHFRCFEEFKLDDLRRINIVVGPNASGKTALMEALLLGGRATPQAALMLQQLRLLPIPGTVLPIGLQLAQLGIAPQSFNSIWNSLFRLYEPERPISISYKDSQNQSFKLRVFYSGEATITSAPLGVVSSSGMSSFGTGVVPLVFERSSPHNLTNPERLAVSLNSQNQLVNPAAPD